MLKLYTWLTDLLRRERGQDMVEYALITILISIAIVLIAIGILEGAFETWATSVEACVTGSTDPATGASNCPF